MSTDHTPRRMGLLPKLGLVGAGVLAGGILATTMTATAATSPTPAPASGAATAPGPGAPGADPAHAPDPAHAQEEATETPAQEAAEHPGGRGHGGPGHHLDLSGTVVSTTGTTVTITTATGPMTYAVTGASDIDKNGEAALKDLLAGDQVRYSVTAAATPTIDKLHAGDETKDRPAGPPPAGAPAAPSSSTA